MTLPKIIKDFVFKPSVTAAPNIRFEAFIPAREAIEALGFYCPLCKRGFKTKAAASSHKSLRHERANQTTQIVS